MLLIGIRRAGCRRTNVFAALAIAVGRVCIANWCAVDQTLYFSGHFPLLLAGAVAPIREPFSYLLLLYAVLRSGKLDAFTLSESTNLLCIFKIQLNLCKGSQYMYAALHNSSTVNFSCKPVGET